jgi:hypothetical protein
MYSTSTLIDTLAVISQCCLTFAGVGSASSSGRTGGREVQRFGVTKEQEQQFKMYLVKAMITSCIAFNFADNEYLAKALGVLGMSPLTRKKVAGPYLDQIAAGEQDWSSKAIESMEYPPGASDGWRKKYCVSGAGLMNFEVMGDNGVLLVFSLRNSAL